MIHIKKLDIKIYKVNELYKTTYISAERKSDRLKQNDLSKKFKNHVSKGLSKYPHLKETFFIKSNNSSKKEYMLLDIKGNPVMYGMNYNENEREALYRTFSINLITVGGSKELNISLTIDRETRENKIYFGDSSMKFCNKRSYLNFIKLLEKIYYLHNPNNNIKTIKKINGVTDKSNLDSKISPDNWAKENATDKFSNLWYFIHKKLRYNSWEAFEMDFKKNRDHWDSSSSDNDGAIKNNKTPNTFDWTSNNT
mgnify:CR=1 FL=1|tara:strand:- start:33320 stop:34078 length:759 start_codon:yes stop_codon:yes gene_type:complete